MAASGRRAGPAVIEDLARNPCRFDAFQVVRLLEMWARRREAEPDRPRFVPVGQDGPPDREPVRFRTLPSHTFPPSSICSLELRKPEEELPPGPLAQVTVSFLGLIGPNGALPHHYTSLVIERLRAKDRSLRDFLDLFNHRLISLFYRAWEKYRVPIQYEQAGASEPPERLTFVLALLALIGLGMPSLQRRMQLDDETCLFYAGFLAHRRPNALSLRRMLEDCFDLPVRVEQFRGQWLYLSADNQSSLPSRECPEGRNCALGENVIVGTRVWSVENAFRIRLGPLRYHEFEQLVPSGETLTRLAQLVRTYVGPEYDFDVQLVLRADEVPASRLGGDGPIQTRLGWNSWLISRLPREDVSDAVFVHEGWPERAGRQPA